LPIKHKFQSQLADGAVTTLVKPSNWNDTHTGQADVTSCSVYSVSGSFNCFSGPTGSCVVFVTASGTAASGANVNFLSVYLPAISGAFIPASQTGLPFSNGTSYVYTVFRKDANPGLVVIFPNIADTSKSPPVTINGQPYWVLANQYQYAAFICDQQNWFVIDGN
jgi:hypothetical protein